MKIKVLANDGISDSGVSLLESKSYEVITENVPQDNLIEYINNNNVSCEIHKIHKNIETNTKT